MSDAFDDLMERQASPADMAPVAAVIAPISLKSKFYSFKHVKPSRRVPVCTENRIRVDDVMESPKLAE